MSKATECQLIGQEKGNNRNEFDQASENKEQFLWAKQNFQVVATPPLQMDPQEA